MAAVSMHYYLLVFILLRTSYTRYIKNQKNVEREIVQNTAAASSKYKWTYTEEYTKY